jgi:hypothetical protein
MSTEPNSQILLTWSEIKNIIEGLEFDVLKSARGVAAAGVRARKGLRALKARSHDLVKLTFEEKPKKED